MVTAQSGCISREQSCQWSLADVVLELEQVLCDVALTAEADSNITGGGTIPRIEGYRVTGRF